ncbi:hypothetical protein D0962_12610 [Leptolyngbyaceae cyanobacterium CCMR0082]|uniref:Uncharacterized protein n=1 Tax=Adonisia turfae CCMR0082 TaxID=2304604 RepID=A0A6M0S521_9CYAN|nr:thioesterase family protein [Adonisia turfae]NEZ63614.1 hypothetical protein [Adonisia turfae CCMR0082]
MGHELKTKSSYVEQVATLQLKKRTSEAKIQWLDSGKPIVVGLEDIHQSVDISLSHDDSLCLCVAGVGSQGCDLAPINNRKFDDWLALLGKARKSLLEILTTRYSDPLDVAGTRVWAAIEALRKASQLVDFELEIDKHDKDSVVFKGSSSESQLYVLTFPIKLTRGKPRIVALIVPEPKLNQSQLSPGNNYLEYNSDIYCLGTVVNSQSNFFYVKFPISYRQVANFSQTVYFSNFFSWIEHVRDLALLPIRKTLGEQLATGDWGMVTNFAEIDILGEAGLDDKIESRIWIGNVSGRQNATVDFNYDWLKVNPNDKKERIALGKLQMTWVKLTKNAAPQPMPLPKFLAEFIERVPNYYIPESCPESFRDISKGKRLYETSSGPNTRHLLAEQSFSTSLEDTDAIGNINFQNYYIFQGRMRDEFFQSIIPEYYRRDIHKGEFRCLQSKVDFLREAMPFDRIEVKMYLQSVCERTVNLIFEYFRSLPNGTREKLAIGRQEAIWLIPDGNGESISASMPLKVKTALLDSVQ